MGKSAKFSVISIFRDEFGGRLPIELLRVYQHGTVLAMQMYKSISVALFESDPVIADRIYRSFQGSTCSLSRETGFSPSRIAVLDAAVDLVLIDADLIPSRLGQSLLQQHGSPVVAYTTCAERYSRLLESGQALESVLLLDAVVDQLTFLVRQWRLRWDLQESRTGKIRELLEVQGLLEDAGIAVWIVDAERRIDWMNCAGERILRLLRTIATYDGPGLPPTMPGVSQSYGYFVDCVTESGQWTGSLQLPDDPIGQYRLMVKRRHSDNGNTSVFLMLAQPASRDSLVARGEPTLDATVAQLRLQGLSPREDQVLHLIATGHSNRSCAALLGLSEKTVEKHRSRLMSKVNAGSLAELVQVVVTANGGPTMPIADDAPNSRRAGSVNVPLQR